ncbi:MAG: DUF1540 domain-containing protein [Clostridia bacterium]|nr:DUF1540 domain-containing protein [Clostridia bacterium]
MNKKCEENSNITCDAKNCIYHTTDCGCTAESIKVSNKNACSCTETCCATFELKNSAVNGI